jgi:hypothetical protein
MPVTAAVASSPLETSQARERDVRELARDHTADALRTLAEIMGDAGATASSRVAAAQAILDRGWGRVGAEQNQQTTDMGAMHLRALKTLSDEMRALREHPPVTILDLSGNNEG